MAGSKDMVMESGCLRVCIKGRLGIWLRQG